MAPAASLTKSRRFMVGRVSHRASTSMQFFNHALFNQTSSSEMEACRSLAAPSRLAGLLLMKLKEQTSESGQLDAALCAAPTVW